MWQALLVLLVMVQVAVSVLQIYLSCSIGRDAFSSSRPVSGQL
mgnify:CR=1 FL=1